MIASLLLLLLACRSAGPEGAAQPADVGRADSSPDPDTRSDSASPHGSLVRPPNVLIVLTDDQGIDKVASYEAHPSPPPTPTIDALAAIGVSFDRAYAYPNCSPTRAALLTGKLGRRTGVGEVIQSRDPEELPVDSYTLPRMLQDAPDPWATAAFGKWHIASYTSETNLDHPLAVGFGTYAGSLSNLNDAWVDPSLDTTYELWDKVEGGEVHLETTYATTDTVDDVLAALPTLAEPWLVYVPTNAPHTPLHEPPEGLADPVDERTSPNVYDAAVQALDTELGRLLEAIDLDDTLVIFASDNGTSEWGVRAPLDPHKAKLTTYEGGIRVPLIVAGPGVARGVRSDALVHLVDVLPTVAELAGVDLAATGEVFDGQSLWPQLRDPDAPGRALLHGETFGPNGRGPALRKDVWFTHGPRFKVLTHDQGASHEIVDLVLDPDEEAPYTSVEDVPIEHQEAAKALLEAQLAFFTSLEPPTW